MKRRYFLLSLLASLNLLLPVFAGDTAKSIGVVDFDVCITESKFGKQEQTSLENIKTQMMSLLEDTEKQVKEVSSKLNDSEYLDGLSPEAEEELKVKFRTLNEELNRYQNQYYQVLNQTQMRAIQMLSEKINEAAQKVASSKKLSMIIRKEAFYFTEESLDVTTSIVEEMNKAFDVAEAKKEDVASKNAAALEEKAKQETKKEVVNK